MPVLSLPPVLNGHAPRPQLTFQQILGQVLLKREEDTLQDVCGPVRPPRQLVDTRCLQQHSSMDQILHVGLFLQDQDDYGLK